jgi:hypothetical protein
VGLLVRALALLATVAPLAAARAEAQLQLDRGLACQQAEMVVPAAAVAHPQLIHSNLQHRPQHGNLKRVP